MWKSVVGWEGWYEVSDAGEVRSVLRLTTVICRGKPQQRLMQGRLLKQNNLKGYRTVDLSQPGQDPRAHLVHVLVMAAFKGPKPPGLEVCHGNGVRRDNQFGNLRYGTRSENALDRHRHGTMNPHLGEENHQHKLTVADVMAIRKSAASTYALAEVYGVHHSTIWSARVGRWWKHVTKVYDEPLDSRPTT